MSRRVWILLSLFFAFVFLVLGLWFFEEQKEKRIQSMRSCLVDADCVYVDKDCCGCGKEIAIHSSQQQFYRELLSCEGVRCATMSCPQKVGAKCVNLMCE